MPVTDLRNRLLAAAARAGAQKAGFTRAEAVDDEVMRRFMQWLEAGNHGAMQYMANHLPVRNDPRLLADDPGSARTVMSCAFSYYHPERQDSDALFAMYAHGDDYHEVLRERLRPLAEMLQAEGFTARICIDTAPIFERYWAVRSGVGFIGRNRQLIVPGMGSYFFLAEIVTSAELEPDEPCTLTCGDCMRCVRACPGGALRADGNFDGRLCLSYLTIEHRGELPMHLRAPGDGNGNRLIADALGNRVYGCDECQSVCPHNVSPPHTGIEEFRLRPSLRNLTRDNILEMTQADFSVTFRHSAVKRAKLAGLQRNARRGGRGAADNQEAGDEPAK